MNFSRGQADAFQGWAWFMSQDRPLNLNSRNNFKIRSQTMFTHGFLSLCFSFYTEANGGLEHSNFALLFFNIYEYIGEFAPSLRNLIIQRAISLASTQNLL